MESMSHPSAKLVRDLSLCYSLWSPFPGLTVAEAEGVPYQESLFKTTISGLRLGPLDGSGSDVHADGLLTESGGEQGVLAGAASHVENFAGETS